MKSYVITEGPTDVAVLAPLLASVGIKDANVVSAGGKAVVSSFSRSVALLKRAPVAVVTDADTTDPIMLEQQEKIFYDLTRGAGPAAFQLFQAVPNLEEALFPTPADFELLYDVTLTPDERMSFTANRLKFLKDWFGRAGNVSASADAAPSLPNRSAAGLALQRAGLDSLIHFLAAPEKRAISV